MKNRGDYGGTMKILVIMGSPRKGNTYRAAQRIEDVMRSLGDVEFEYLMLKDVGLKTSSRASSGARSAAPSVTTPPPSDRNCRMPTE